MKGTRKKQTFWSALREVLRVEATAARRGRRRRRAGCGSRRAGGWRAGGPRRAGPGRGPRPPDPQSPPASDAAGDDQVERDQEVGGVAAGVQGDAEGESGDDRQRQQRSASGGRRSRGRRPRRRRARAGRRCRSLSWRRSTIWWRVPLVAEDQDREEDEGEPASPASARGPRGSRIVAAAAAAATSSPAPARKSLKAPLRRRGAAVRPRRRWPLRRRFVQPDHARPGPGVRPSPSSFTRSL